MFFFIWLGAVLTGLQTGCSTNQTNPAASISMVPVESRRAVPREGVIPRGIRNMDYPQIPKVPPPGARMVYNSIHIGEPVVALTFDDGPHATNTPRLLNILKERNIKATFFVVGQCAREYPHLIRRILADGHEIGNHTWSHRSLPTLSEATVRSELTRTAEAVQEAGNYHMRLMRPPYGATNSKLKKWFYDEYGYPTILWDVDPFDWKRPGAAAIKNRIIAGTHNGSIILCHDIHSGTIDAMPDTLDTLLGKGYRFVTVSQLLNMESPGASATVPAQAAVHTAEAAPLAGS